MCGLSNAIADLRANPNVLTLDLVSLNLRGEGAKALANALATNNTLTELYLRDNRIGDEGAKAFAVALATNNTLEKLILYSNDFGIVGTKVLANALASSNTLKELTLYNNSFGDEGVKAFAVALATNNTLKELSWHDKFIGDEGAKALAVALATNNTLKELFLYNNRIGDEGAKALAVALATNKTLKHLWLDENRIRYEGAKALADSLATNNTLKELILQTSSIRGIGDEVIKDFVKAMMENRTMTSLRVLHVFCWNEYHKVIKFFLRLNRKGRDSLSSPTPIPLSVWTEVAREPPPDILYFLLRERSKNKNKKKYHTIVLSQSACLLIFMQNTMGFSVDRFGRGVLLSTRTANSTSTARRRLLSTKLVDDAAAAPTALEDAVRTRLRNEFPREFGATTTTNQAMLLSSFRTLLSLNGFHKVVTPTGTKSRLYLAEGIVVTPPRWNLKRTAGLSLSSMLHTRITGSTGPPLTKDRLFAQPINGARYLHPGDNPAASTFEERFPEFVQADMPVYRMIENSAARFLDRRYAAWNDWTQKRFLLPLQNAKYRTRLWIKSANKTQQRIHEILEKSLLERCIDTIQKHTRKADPVLQDDATTQSGKQDDRTIATVDKNDQLSDANNDSTSKHPPSTVVQAKDDTVTVAITDNDNTADQDQDDEEDDDNALETLMVISSQPRFNPNQTKEQNNRPAVTTDTDDDDDDEIVLSATLYRRMTPSTRILSLPDYYVLRHSSASTLASVSLIVLGAIPLSYRSYVFSIHYDWLIDSSMIAASVVATISYYIYVNRWNHRTSQSKTVSEALAARIYARDDAALWILREGAVRTVSKALIEEANAGNAKNTLPTKTKTNHPLIDTREWAADFGLILPPKKDSGIED